jgi:hypothetical protein
MIRSKLAKPTSPIARVRRLDIVASSVIELASARVAGDPDALIVSLRRSVVG